MRTDVLGIGFDSVTMEEAISMAYESFISKETHYAVTPNPEMVWESRKNQEFKDAINNADFVIPDGIGIIYGAKILKRPLKGRVPGIDFAERIIEKMSHEQKSLFILGAKPGIADIAAENLKKKYPGLRIAGTENGYFKDDAPVIDKINETAPDFLLVCLGFPKQELWMAANKDRLNVKLMAGLGGAADVFAGVVDSAPEKWQKLNLEWLYRLLKEPSRIKRMMKLPLFIFAVIGQRLRSK